MADQRTVLVTGATRGIGEEVARQLLARGDRVVVTGRDPARVAATASGLGGDAVGVVLDVADPAAAEAAAAEVADRGGALDVLVNNAAIHYDTWQRASSADLGVVREALDTNLLGAWQVTLAMLPLLRRSAHPRIVNVSSEAGAISEMTGGIPAYAVSKAALNALTRLLAGELRAERILVNAVCPGWVATDMGGPGGRPVAEGAASVTWAVDLPDDGPTGGFFRDGQRLPW
jgi:NAD(P)-dependent dehydrogenase (short-subunit alcohol dehydrogenase family)